MKLSKRQVLGKMSLGYRIEHDNTEREGNLLRLGEWDNISIEESIFQALNNAGYIEGIDIGFNYSDFTITPEGRKALGE